MFNKYYQDELTFLREMGAEFARANPKIANLLSDRSADPDVERLLEGFAFLAARLRQKLDDELPEVTHGLIGLLWPHYLRPVPAMSILEFQPVLQALRQTLTVPRGVSVQSVPVEVPKLRSAGAVPARADVPQLSVTLTYLPVKLALTLPLAWGYTPAALA